VAYGSLLHERRRAVHARIVETIERLYADRLTEHIDRLAHHALKGEAWQKAVAYLRQAGAKALTRCANREAAASFEQAQAALTHVPQTRETAEQAIDLRFDLRNALWPLGEFEKLLAVLTDAERLAKTLDDPRRLGWVSAYMSANLWITGRPAQARSAAQETLAIGEALGDLPLQIAATFYLGTTGVTSGDFGRSEEALLKIVHLLEGDRSRERCGLPFYPSVMARSWLVWSLAERGEFAEGIAHGEQETRTAETLDHPYSLAHVCYDLGYLYSIKGEFGTAVRLLERAFALTRDWHLTFLWPLVTWFSGHAYVDSSRVAEGLALLEEAQATFETMGSGAFRSLALVHLGKAYLVADRRADALASAGRALAFARERGQRSYQAHALRLRGEIAAGGGALDVAEAEAHYRDALALASELGMRPLVAHCHLDLGRLDRWAGRPQEAHQHLTTASMMYRDMSMQVWLQQAEAEMRHPG
jgi:tetratricopeptide (TPR) repeat protein